MIKLSKKVEYALMILKHLSSKIEKNPTSAKEICILYKSTFDLTSKVMQTLTQKKILKSEQGIYGGYSIVSDLSNITLLELIETVNGKMSIAKCLEGKCSLKHFCNVSPSLKFLNEKVKDFYKSITLKELLYPSF